MRGGAKARQEIARAVEAIATGYEPLRIVLFGSFAYGRPNDGSDIDLLIVKDTCESRLERSAAVEQLAKEAGVRRRVEPWVFTPAELGERLALSDPFFLEMVGRGEVLLDRESRVPREWFARAQRDLRVAQAALALEDLENTGLHLQQAAEKAIKALLLTRRPRARLTHDLTKLLDEAQGWWPDLVRHRALGARLTRYYQARYPMQELPLDQETLSGDLAAVEALLSELASLAPIGG